MFFTIVIFRHENGTRNHKRCENDLNTNNKINHNNLDTEIKLTICPTWLLFQFMFSCFIVCLMKRIPNYQLQGELESADLFLTSRAEDKLDSYYLSHLSLYQETPIGRSVDLFSMHSILWFFISISVVSLHPGFCSLLTSLYQQVAIKLEPILSIWN